LVRHLPGLSAGAQPTWRDIGLAARPSCQTPAGSAVRWPPSWKPGFSVRRLYRCTSPTHHQFSTERLSCPEKDPGPGGRLRRQSPWLSESHPELDGQASSWAWWRASPCQSGASCGLWLASKWWPPGSHISSCGWAPQSARGPPGVPPFSM